MLDLLEPIDNSVPVSLLRRAIDPAAGETLVTGPPRTEDYSIYAGWPGRFDYVLMMDFGRRENPLPSILTAVRTGSYFTLYKITAPPVPAAG